VRNNTCRESKILLTATFVPCFEGGMANGHMYDGHYNLHALALARACPPALSLTLYLLT